MAFQRRKLAAIGVKAPYLGFIEAGRRSIKGPGRMYPLRASE
jgi:hypothetical protein